MHSALAGGPHFLAHNLLLPFLSYSSRGGVCPIGCTLQRVSDGARVNVLQGVCFPVSSAFKCFQGSLAETALPLLLYNV